jgi:hypothetical protein
MERLNCNWIVWYHYDINSWTIDSFVELIKITTVQEFWYFVESLKTISNLLIEHMYIMREGIKPMWEDPRNRNGGCWSIKIDIKDTYVTFVKILMYLITENILVNNEENLSEGITGVSLCQKNNYNCILQIWNSDKKYNKVNYLPKEFTDSFGVDILFRIHNPEY